jgi:hypothetical protein
MSASLSVPAACIARSARHHHDAALVVADAGPGGPIAFAAEALEGRFGLEHGIEMADQKHPLAAPVALVGGDEVARPLRLGHGNPADGKAERFQLRPNHPPDRFHTRQIEGAAILVHQLFKEAEGPLALALHGLDHLLLGRAEPRIGGGG